MTGLERILAKTLMEVVIFVNLSGCLRRPCRARCS